MPLQRRIPKRGFTNIFKKYYAVVNVSDMDRFTSGSEVGPREFVEAGLVRKMHEGIKLLADGELSIPLTVHVHKASVSAIRKIEAAGGRVELIPSLERN